MKVDGEFLRLLEAMERLGWNDCQYQENEEHYGEWYSVGVDLLVGGFDMYDLVDFMKQAPAIIRRLLDETEEK